MVRKIKNYNKRWASLTPSEKATRVRALEALRLMKEGKSLSNASKSVGISPRTAKSQLGRVLFKRKRRWHARPKDRVERGLIIYDKGRIVQIVVSDSETASQVGQYLNDTKKVLVSGDESILKRYKKVVIIDANGKKHKLETRLEKIKIIEFSREDVEFSDIYAY